LGDIQMTLYADILFVVNFVMNGFLLWVLSKVTRKPVKKRWLFVGAGLMALCYTLAFVFWSFENVALASVVILSAGIGVTFRPRDWRLFLKLMVAAYVITFTVGGLGMALFFLTAWEGVLQEISWWLVLLGMGISYAAIKISMKIFERYTLKRQMLCHVHVSVGENDCNFDALVDTGHSLKEPLSQSPVIIAEFDEVKPLLPDRLKVLFYENLENDLSVLLTVREESFYSRIRMIPFTSLGRNNGMLIGFRPDRVQVEGANSNHSDIVIGIYNDKLSNDGRYRGLLSPELVA
jgi:stage II sporulation protein GA (sporulation sigma-E factor processing peptidase)